jgi:hypothetical protein
MDSEEEKIHTEHNTKKQTTEITLEAGGGGG